jgi:hypothetical protein
VAESVHRTTENAGAFGSRRRGKSVHIQRSLRWMSLEDGMSIFVPLGCKLSNQL